MKNDFQIEILKHYDLWIYYEIFIDFNIYVILQKCFDMYQILYSQSNYVLNPAYEDYALDSRPYQ